MPFKAYYLSAKGDLRPDLDEDEVRKAFESKRGVLWVDISGTTHEDGEFLQRAFGFHHLTVEDCVSEKVHPSKIDDLGDHLFIVVHGINHAAESDIVETTELALFLGAHFVVSAHHVPLYSVDNVARLAEDDGRPLRRGADFLAHALIDALVDNVLPTVDRMTEVADDIEEEAISRPQQSTLEAIMKLKRSTLGIHRVMAPQRETMHRLSRREFSLISEEALLFYRDVYDHITRIEDFVQSVRDTADNALSTYLSAVAIQQNETMRVLSIVAAVFLPLTLLAGIYGMNFENMPELKWSWAYFAVLGLMGTVAVATVSWFWARRWIVWGRRHVPRVRPLAVEPEKLVGYLGHLHIARPARRTVRIGRLPRAFPRRKKPE
jgi:magnesium transporter